MFITFIMAKWILTLAHGGVWEWSALDHSIVDLNLPHSKMGFCGKEFSIYQNPFLPISFLYA